jgi:NAD(P)H-hydrate epimerase
MSTFQAITAEEMARIDREAIKFGIPPFLLMENAGGAVARTTMEKFGRKLKIIVFAGTGNNGGDGFVAARHLANGGAKVKVFLIGEADHIRTEEAQLNWGIIKRMKSVKIYFVKSVSDVQKIHVKGVEVIIDAMLGSGLKGRLKEPLASIAQLINKSGIPVVSVDTPTGINPSTGEIHGAAIKATYTITFHRMKSGFSNAKTYTGEVIVADIGIPADVETGVLGKNT